MKYIVLIISLFIDLACSGQKLDYNKMFNECNDYKSITNESTFQDTITGMEIHLPGRWEGSFQSEFPTLIIKKVNFKDTIQVWVYPAIKVGEGSFGLQENKKFKSFTFNGNKTLVALKKTYQDRDFVEIYYEIGSFDLEYDMMILSTPNAITKEIICDAKSMLWQYSEFYASKKKSMK